MNTRTCLAASSLALLFAASLFAAAEKPKPGAEQKRFDYYVGTWSIEATAAASPFGPAGKVSGTQVVERGPGGFSITFRSDLKTPSGPVQALGVLAYDANKKAYLYHGVDSMGIIATGAGSVTGPKWSWTTDDKVGGKSIKGRFTLTEESPTSYSYKYEMSGEDGKWTTVEEGKATKSKST